jgi:hypothetical protein
MLWTSKARWAALQSPLAETAHSKTHVLILSPYGDLLQPAVLLLYPPLLPEKAWSKSFKGKRLIVVSLL